MMAELRERVEELKESHVKIDDLSPEDVYDLLEFEADGDPSMNISNHVSKKMLKQVRLVKDERRLQLNDAIRKKLGEKDKKLSRLLKFRVVDGTNPKKTGLVSWWSPTEELLEIIKEGEVIEILNSSAGLSGTEIHIKAGTSSAVKIAKTKIPPERIMKFFRNETKITEIKEDFSPPQQEFDVACVIVRVDMEQEKQLPKVYVADEFMNILCINFWSSLSDKAFDDVVIEGRIVYVRNLQWRLSHAKSEIPQAFVVNDTTTFSAHPKRENQRSRLRELEEALGNVMEFVANCKETIGTGRMVNKENQQHHNTSINQVKPIVQPPQLSKTLNNSAALSTTSTPVRKTLGVRWASSGRPCFSNTKPNCPQTAQRTKSSSIRR